MEYNDTLKAARIELADLLDQRKQIDTRISQLKQAIMGLLPLAQAEIDGEGTPEDINMKALERELHRDMTSFGITDACREVLKGAEGPLTPKEIKERISLLNPALAKQGNLAASVHTVLKRLVPKEAKSSTSENGHVVYRWIYRFPRTRKKE